MHAWVPTYITYRDANSLHGQIPCTRQGVAIALCDAKGYDPTSISPTALDRQPWLQQAAAAAAAVAARA